MIYKTPNFVLKVQVCGDGYQTQEIKTDKSTGFFKIPKI
jgi:hypothetical protein